VLRIRAQPRPGGRLASATRSRSTGVCLTVTGVEPAGDGAAVWSTDVMAETLRRSSLGGLADGDPVNLERGGQRAHPPRRARRAGPRRRRGHRADPHPGEHWEVVRVALPPELARYVVEKGSVTVDGVSLTVSAVSAVDDREPWFEVSLIPTTLRETTLGAVPPGNPVNLEVDVIAKYVERLLGARS
jgi:riboflavin synthase